MLDLKQEDWTQKNADFHQIGNIKIVKARKQEILDELRFRLSIQLKTRILFLDVQAFNLAQENPRYRQNLNAAEFVLNEGAGVKLAAKAFNINLKEDLRSAEITSGILEIMDEEKMSVFLLGGEAADVRQASETLAASYPNIVISGIRDINFTDPVELVDDINRVSPDLLLVGMGVPVQEGWISHYFFDLDTTLIMAVGDFRNFNFTGRAEKSVFNIKREKGWERRLSGVTNIFNKYIIGNGVFFINIMKLARK